MSSFGNLISRTRLAIAGGVVMMLFVAWLLPMGGDERTVTAHFPQAVSIFEGSDVTIMGVSVGRVTEIVPEGDSVKVVMTYSGEHKLPADVKAAIVTPTLVADRFVQLVPAYASGPVLPDNGDIPLERSIVPVEMDRI
jgi:phospholipid/cholesterol/gamma-HCH transport system substrate-binding protein